MKKCQMSQQNNIQLWCKFSNRIMKTSVILIIKIKWSKKKRKRKKDKQIFIFSCTCPCRFASALLLNKNWTISIWPFWQAQIRAVSESYSS